MTPLESLQAALAGEHAALYVYGVLGGRVSESGAPSTAAAVRSAYETHRARRDQLQLLVRELGGDPVAAEVAYDLQGPAETTAQIEREARGLETRCAAVYAQVVASTASRQRRWAVQALTDAAVRGLGFGASPEPFPGAPDL